MARSPAEVFASGGMGSFSPSGILKLPKKPTKSGSSVFSGDRGDPSASAVAAAASAVSPQASSRLGAIVITPTRARPAAQCVANDAFSGRSSSSFAMIRATFSGCGTL